MISFSFILVTFYLNICLAANDLIKELLFKALRTRGVCNHLYIDMGTNVGVQFRKLYEPNYYLNAPVLPIFQSYFGADRKKVCAVGFEPNLHHTAHLQNMQEAYRAAGFPLFIFTETALFSKVVNLTLFDDISRGGRRHHLWGASLYNAQNSSKTFTVATIDTGHFLHHMFGSWERDTNSKVVAKLDIEGAEYEVMPSIIGHGSLCHIDLMFTEWHKVPTNSDYPFPNSTVLSEVLSLVSRHTSQCRFKSTTLDDESYSQIKLIDHPYPTSVVSKGQDIASLLSK